MPQHKGLRSIQREALSKKVDPLAAAQDLWTLSLIRDIQDERGVVGNWPDEYHPDSPRSMYITWAGLNGPPAFYENSISRLHRAGKITASDSFCDDDPTFEIPSWFVEQIGRFRTLCPLDTFAKNWGFEYNYEVYDEGKTNLPYTYDSEEDIKYAWGYWRAVEAIDIKARHPFFMASNELLPTGGVCKEARVPCPGCGLHQYLPLVRVDAVTNYEKYLWLCKNTDCDFFRRNDPLIVTTTENETSWDVEFSVAWRYRFDHPRSNKHPCKLIQAVGGTQAHPQVGRYRTVDL